MKGSRNTPSQQPQPYLNIVRISTIPLPSISDFNIIDKDPSQITREAKEAIHIRRLDPNLNRNIGEMSIPHCFDPLLGAKPKHPQVGALSQVAPQSVDEIAPLSQIPSLNLTQFNNIGILDQMWLNTYLDPPLGHAGLETCSIDPQLSCLPLKINTDQALYHLT